MKLFFTQNTKFALEQLLESFLTYFFSHKLELFAALTGLVCVWLNTRNNHWGWFFGIVSVVPYIYIFFESGLYGDSILSAFYFVVSIWGWYHWLFGGRSKRNKAKKITKLSSESSILDKNVIEELNSENFYDDKMAKEENTELPITHMPIKFWVISMVVGIAGVFGFGAWFSTLPNASVPYFDAFTTSFSVVGQFQLAKRWVENWIFWFVIDVVCVGIYYYKELYFTTGLYSVFLVLAVLGYFEWKKQMNE
ncbi:nicotinamide riboside transporter PnuC [Bernardetia sp. OM2101]|uniref:nicotinamide riboside transporter PnuC n=1 Tax=Bernardetia sp. OM2101 TaxID=3344876 RepID=UPI0035D02683